MFGRGPKGSDSPSRDQLLRENRRLREEVARLRDDNRRLHERIEALERAAKRQSAPFSKGKPNPNPKTAGRKPGDPRPRKRRAVPERVDERIDVALPACCPACSGALRLERRESQFHIDIPDPRIFVTEFQIAVGECLGCGKRVQSRHPLQTSDAVGAANVQLGPRLVATATLLNKGLGISHEKIADALKAMFGLDVSRSGLARAIDRVGVAGEPTYDAICDAVAASEVVVPDETGWRIGGRSAWLWVFATAELTAYQVCKGRGREAAAALLGEDYAGVIVRDGWVVYRGFDLATHQTCTAHLLRRCASILETARGRARTIPLAVREILLDALALRARRDLEVISTRTLRAKIRALDRRVDALIAITATNQVNRRLLRHIARERDALFTFLTDPRVDATNWRAEQAIRPAVVARKVWGGNRTARGAHAYEILATLLRTARQQGINAIDTIIDLLRSTDWDVAQALKPALASASTR